jgi:hypothetical protein
MTDYTVLDTSYEFSVFDDDYVEQAGGTAPTLEQAWSEGQHYLAIYSEEGPHVLELRRVERISMKQL